MRTGLASPLIPIIRQRGARFGNGRVNVRYLQHPIEYRYSPVISKRQGNAAERNRVKRSIRGIMQRMRHTFPRGWYIIYVNETCSAYDRRAVEQELIQIVADITRLQRSCDPATRNGHIQTDRS